MLCVQSTIFTLSVAFIVSIYLHSHMDALCNGQLKPVYLILQTCRTEWLFRIKWFAFIHTALALPYSIIRKMTEKNRNLASFFVKNETN